MLGDLGIDKITVNSIFSIIKTVGGVEVLNGIPGEATNYLRKVVKLLSIMDVNNIEINLGVVRGLDYYTGIVFEIESPPLGAEKQICGGGSYMLSELFGGDKVFSTGFAIGFDRILLAIEKEGQTY